MNVDKKQFELTHIHFITVFLILPVFSIFEFLLQFIAGSGINKTSYAYLLTFILLSFYFRKKIENILIFELLFIYFIIYLFFENGNTFNIARELINFILIIISLFLFSKSDVFGVEGQSKIKLFLYWFTIVFTSIFFISVFLEKGNSLDFNERRTYFDGFIIAHSFNYYIIPLGLYLFKNDHKKIGILSILIGGMTGTRSGLLLSLITLLSILFDNTKNKTRMVIRICLGSILVVLSIIFLRKYVPTIDQSMKTFELLLSGYSSFDLNNKSNIEFSEGRTYIWSKVFYDFSNLTDIDFMYLIYGAGSLYVENILKVTNSSGLWMHNDFLQIFYCYGLFGVVMYLLGILNFCIKRKSMYCFLFIMVAASVNGFYKYHAFQIVLLLYLITQDNKPELISD